MKTSKGNTIFWGAMLITAAAVALLANVVTPPEGIGTFALLLTIPLAIGIVYKAFLREWGGLFFTAGWLAFLWRVPIYDATGIWFGFWITLLVATLLAIGFRLLFKKSSNRTFFNLGGINIGVHHTDDDGNVIIGKDGDVFADSTETVDGERLYFKCSFGGSSKYVTSDNLSYVSVKNSFAGMDVYLENATLAPGGAVVEIENSFGGVDIYVPRGWNVINEMRNSFGGTEVPSKTKNDGAPTLTIRGENSFGGIEVNLV